MTTAQIALSIVMIVASLFLIVVVLLQNGAQIFARLTSVVGVIFVIAALVLNLIH